MLKIEGGGEWLSTPATLPEVGIKPVEEEGNDSLTEAVLQYIDYIHLNRID